MHVKYAICLFIYLSFCAKLNINTQSNILKPLLQTATKEVKFQKCAVSLIQKYCVSKKRNGLIVVNQNIGTISGLSQQSIDLKSGILPPPDNTKKCYLLYIGDQESLNYFYEKLTNNSFNSKAIFIFFISTVNLPAQFVQTLANYYIVKVLLVDYNFLVYTYFPYKYENMDQPDTELFHLGTCNKGKELVKTLFDGVLPKYWRNSTVNIYYRNAPPYANDKYTGAEQTLYSTIFKHLGVKVLSQLGALTFQGFKNNKTFGSEGFSLLFKKKVHIIVGGYQAISELYHDFDSSPIYFLQPTYLFTPSSLKKSPLEILYSVTFTKGVGVLASVIIIWCTFVRLAYGQSYGSLIGICYSLSTSQPIMMINSLKFRCALGGLMVGLLLYNMVAFSYIKVNFLNEQHQKDVNTIEDVLQSNLKVFVGSEMLHSYIKGSGKLDSLLVNKLVLCQTELSYCLKQVCRDRSAAIIGSNGVIRMLALTVCPNQVTGEATLHVGQHIAKHFIQTYFIKGFPMAAEINKVLIKIWFTAGIIRKEENVAIFHYDKSVINKLRRSVKSTSLVQEMFSGYVYYFLVFYSVSTLVFLGEVLVGKIKNKHVFKNSDNNK